MARKNQEEIALLAHLMRRAGAAAETNHRRDPRQGLMDRLEEMRQHESDQRPRDQRAAGPRPQMLEHRTSMH